MNNIEAINITETTKPVRRSRKQQGTADAFVGKDILEIISVSMYVEPLTMYREYIQNATDSIDQAVASGLLSDLSQGEVRVVISQSARSINVRDNGQGISSRKFAKIMLSFGASEKRGTEARGFRGVGRFAGLGYCQQLTFRTKAAGESKVSEIEWDGRILKRLLADNTELLSISELVKRVAVLSQYESDNPSDHFFEVEIKSVTRMGNDVLLNEELVKRYISQVCPVPYSDEFKFKNQLESLLAKHEISCGYNIVVEDDFSDSVHIHRPYRDHFRLTEAESDEISQLDRFEIEGVNGGIAAIGWIFQHKYKGLVPSVGNIRGIRVRVGNTQIGEDSLMTPCFPEPRFNSWCLGEIHILERKITPNGRRDNFDTNIHWLELQNQFTSYAKSIARICRKNSAERNAIKQFNAEIDRAAQYKVVLDSGVLSKAKAKEIRDNLAESLIRAENLAKARQIGESARTKLGKVLKKHRNKPNPDRNQNSNAHEVFDVIPRNKTAAVKEIFDFIFECSPNKVVAQSLIDKIIDQYKIRYRR